MTLYSGLDILDADGLRADQVLRVQDGTIAEIRPRRSHDHGISLSRSGSRALVCPGLIDLQVNGGAGLMLGDCETIDDLRSFAEAHRTGGALGLLPTLITDTPDTTARIIDLVSAACKEITALLGLHLEGPHLTVPGAHDAARLRPMTKADLALYLDAAKRLPHLMITLAPELADTDQIAALAKAGVCVSLGHSACEYDSGVAAFDAGARGATHLFNAMSGLHHRRPGLVGAALDRAGCIGLICDLHHVHPAALRLALRARPEAVYLISDAMAVAGTDAAEFLLGGRCITRQDGRLTLSDGTLAGADITLFDAALRLAEVMGVALADTLPHAFDAPHRLLYGVPARLSAGQPARLLQIADNRLIATLTGDSWTPV